MSIPQYNINSITYATASSVLTINSNYKNLRGGGSMSITGVSPVFYFSISDSGQINNISTYSISLSSSTLYNFTFSFFKGGYYNVNEFGITASTLSYGLYRDVATNITLQT